MRIFDCFMYFDEEIVLDTRLNYLDPYVDYFVIIESSYTHRGDKRELQFDIKKYEKDFDKSEKKRDRINKRKARCELCEEKTSSKKRKKCHTIQS